jgi:hypothetical protein
MLADLGYLGTPAVTGTRELTRARAADVRRPGNTSINSARAAVERAIAHLARSKILDTRWRGRLHGPGDLSHMGGNRILNNALGLGDGRLDSVSHLYDVRRAAAGDPVASGRHEDLRTVVVVVAPLPDEVEGSPAGLVGLAVLASSPPAAARLGHTAAKVS